MCNNDFPIPAKGKDAQETAVMPRRHFLWTAAGGIGGIALAWMLEREARAADRAEF